MSAKHTPGPWRLYQGPLLYVEADNHVGPIAELRSRLDYGRMHPLVAETRDANARLIAAAPELLEALKAMVALDEEHHQRCQGDEDVCREVRQARYAIAKAIGDTK